MNFIYYLEYGEDLEKKVSRRKSKKTVFFASIKDTKWEYFTEYKKFIDKFDDKLRTPEQHKPSILRKSFLTDHEIKSEEVIGIVNIVMNIFWQGLDLILQGEDVSYKSCFKGMDD